MASDRPDCPPWCVVDHAKYEVCKSAHDYIRSDAGEFTVFAARTTGNRGDIVHVQGSPRDDGPLVVWLTASDAADLAGVLDMVADATPDEHRKLAAQLRAASAALSKEDPDE